MISGVRSVGIYVDDQDRAKRFWTESLGFDLLQDTPMGATTRWIEIAPPDRGVILVLFTPDEQRDRIGSFSNVIFHCADIIATHATLAERGVQFIEEPVKQFWGWWAMFSDVDGNTYGLGQSGE
jgi:predicted enzyme related to lactoylglutathione lyase